MLFGQELRGNRRIGSFVSPLTKRDPPPVPVVNQFDAVDAAGNDWPVRSCSGFIGAKDLCNGAEGLHDAVDFALVKAMLDHCVVGPVNVRLMVHSLRADLPVLSRNLDELYFWNVQRSVARPLPGRPRRSRNHIVESFDYAIKGPDVFGSRRSDGHVNVAFGLP